MSIMKLAPSMDYEGNLIMIPLDVMDCFVYKIIYDLEVIGYIALFVDKGASLEMYDRIAIEQFALAYRIIFLRDKEVKQVEQRYIEEFTHELLSGKLKSESVMINRAQALGWNISFPISILLIDMESEKSLNKKDIEKQIRLYLNMYTQFKNKDNWGYFVVYNGTYIVMFLDGIVSDNYNKIGNYLSKFFESAKINDYYIGISKKAYDIEDMEKIYWQGEKSLSIAKMLKKKPIMHFNETGIYRIIFGIDNKEDLVDFCEEKLGSIIKYDKQHNADLINTLNKLIENRYSIKKTSEAMFVHYNTIRYRARVIGELLNCPLDSISFLQDIVLALKVYDVLQIID